MSPFLRWLVPIGFFGTLCGCSLLRGPDPTVELLESELRWMEDNLYVLDEQLNRCCEQLESARRNNAVLRDELARAKTSVPPQQEAAPPDAGEPTGRFDQPRDDELYDLSSPVVDTGDPTPPPSGSDEAPTDGHRDDIRIEAFPDPRSEPADKADRQEDPFTQQNSPPRVDRIALNQRLTGGFDVDGKSGHDGVMVVVEPQCQGVGYVAIPGQLTVEVTDPTKTGLDARIGKWSFDAVECASHMKKTVFGQGVHLQLPWPDAPPHTDELQLRVVYETTDGRTLQATKRIKVKLPTEALVTKSAPPSSPSWSPRR